MAETVNLTHTGAQIDKAIDDVSSLLTHLDGINKDDYNDLKTEVSTLSSRINNYGSNIVDNSRDIANIEDILNTLNETVKQDSTRLTTVQTNQTNYNSALSSKVEVDAYNAKMTQLDDEDNTLKDSIKTLQESFDIGYKDLTGKINTNSSSIATNAQNLKKLTKVFDGTEGATILVEKINKLDFDTIDGLTANVNEIVNEIEGDNGINAQIATIRNTYAMKTEIPTDYATLEQLGNYMLTTDVESLTNSLAARIDTLEEINTSLKETIADLQKQIDTLKGEINNANSGQ